MQNDLRALCDAATSGPWGYVPATERHGPYVTSDFGSDIADCYTMTRPDLCSVRNGGESKPVHFMGEMADANAKFIAAAREAVPALLSQVEALERDKAALVEALREIVTHNQVREWTATEENPETHWERRDGPYAKIARTTLASIGATYEQL